MISIEQIIENVHRIKAGLPPGVRLEAAAKTQSVEAVDAAITAGVDFIGQNYVQEGAAVAEIVKGRIPMHFIGHLQKNKINKAIALFDAIETIDSTDLADAFNLRCGNAGKVLDVLIEINSGREAQKFGVMPEDARSLTEHIASHPNLRLTGLMTMGPFSSNPEEARPYFKTTKKLFDDLASADIPGVEMRDLSMGMTSSYKVAIEEGANIVRIGTLIFGTRPPK
ncbi:YggS family pyridoxal phosphate-dependent enzyme [bacterium]|nr:YggS family pyridoxal phosphate-dependent enzyme [bacterium]